MIVYNSKIINIGKEIKKIFLVKDFCIYPSELSETIIADKPNANRENLYLKYLIFSFDIKQFIVAIKINKGM